MGTQASTGAMSQQWLKMKELQPWVPGGGMLKLTALGVWKPSVSGRNVLQGFLPFKPDFRTRSRGGSATPAGSLPLGDSPEVAHKPLGDWGLREEPGPQRCPSRPAAQSPCVLQWSAGPLSTTSHTWLCQGQNS